MILGEVFKYLNGFSVVIHKNYASTNRTYSLSDNAAVRTIVIEWESMEAAENGYNSPDYQNAIKALDNGAKRAFMYLDAD